MKSRRLAYRIGLAHRNVKCSPYRVDGELLHSTSCRNAWLMCIHHCRHLRGAILADTNLAGPRCSAHERQARRLYVLTWRRRT
jgi:hypothetical protein